MYHIVTSRNTCVTIQLINFETLKRFLPHCVQLYFEKWKLWCLLHYTCDVFFSVVQFCFPLKSRDCFLPDDHAQIFKTCYVILRIWLWGKSIIIPSNKRDEIHSFYNMLTDYFGIPRRQFPEMFSGFSLLVILFQLRYNYNWC